METNYKTQAAELLKSFGVKFSANFVKYAPHFSDDKESRDIFNVTFSRSGNKFSLRFGQSIIKSTRTGKNKPTEY